MKIQSRYWNTMAVYRRRCAIKTNYPWNLRLVMPRHRMHVLTDEEFNRYDVFYIMRKLYRYTNRTAHRDEEEFTWRLG